MTCDMKLASLRPRPGNRHILRPRPGRASLGKMMFPVQRLGANVRADWELFITIYCILFSNIIFTIFLPKKDFADSRLATILATRWTGNKPFLRVA